MNIIKIKSKKFQIRLLNASVIQSTVRQQLAPLYTSHNSWRSDCQSWRRDGNGWPWLRSRSFDWFPSPFLETKAINNNCTHHFLFYFQQDFKIQLVFWQWPFFNLLIFLQCCIILHCKLGFCHISKITLLFWKKKIILIVLIELNFLKYV